MCDATSGAVILFERKNDQPVVGDVGHVGIAFQNPDGTWSAGAIEGPPSKLNAATGVGSGAENGGWAQIFKTKADVINEFSKDRSSASNGIKPHAAYDSYKIISVDNVDFQHQAQAYQEIMKFNDETGFSVWTNNDCLTYAVAVMKAYGANVPDAKLLNKPKSYFDKLSSPENSLNAAVAEATLGENAASTAQGSGNSPTANTQGTTPAVLDAFSVGTPQSPAKGQETSPTDTSKSNIQGTAQTELTVNDKNFPIGSKVETTDSLNVRSGPGLSYNTVSESPEATGSMATTLAEPVKADGFTWYQIKYDDGTTGWSEDKRLELAPTNIQDKQPTTQSSGPAFGDNQKQQPSTTTSPQPTGKIKPVTLILYVNEGNQNGHAIIGAEVTGQDGSGKSFQQTTDSHGSVIISGNPGTWSFSASAFGYETNSWSQPVTESCPQHASLQKAAVKTNLQFGSNTSAPQGSGNSVVGEWTGHIENEATFPGGSTVHDMGYTVNYNRDGTYTQTSETNGKVWTGRWTQQGNSIILQNSEHSVEETINGDTISGTDSGPDGPGGVYSFSWSESRVSTG